ncbi:MAG: hypothetical protein JOZ14_10435 [Acidobacteria bacterium]|nr:hypothetical protein [Acidobacteriota bacterium]
MKAPTPQLTVNVNITGAGTGTITSSPAGIDCSSPPSTGTCQASFQGVTSVTLTASPATGFGFGTWSGCSPTNGTTCTVSGSASVGATFTASLQSINHIIFLAQENRSFDSYFGALRECWAQT